MICNFFEIDDIQCFALISNAPVGSSLYRNFKSASFSFSFVQMGLKTRHAERVEGCGSPVETFKHRRCLEAPTEPTGEKEVLLPLTSRGYKKDIANENPDKIGVFAVLSERSTYEKRN